VSQTASAAPKIIYVNNASKANCSNTGPGTAVSPYCTIQEGVNAAVSGNEVEVLGGTYSEQVTIGSSKSGITLTGVGSKTILKVPSSVTAGGNILEISGATGVTVQDLTVSGPFDAAGCNDNENGVNVDQAANVKLDDVRVTDIEDSNSALFGCQQGVGINIGDSSIPTTGIATVTDGSVDNYQKGGITVDGTGSSATIKNNSITGIGSTPAIAQNGIQISDGATATLSDNIVKANIYSPQTVTIP
jgi:pectin methylesterase-like acyl-CoA thioesterase